MSSGPNPVLGALRRMGNLFASFRQDRRGNIAMMTALIAIPLILAAGGTTDLAMMMFAKTQMQDTADAAGLAAVNAANAYLSAQSTVGAAQIAQAQTVAQTTAASYIAANSSNIALTAPLTPTTTTSVTNGGVTVQVNFTGSKPAIFLPLIGVNQLNIDISSATTAPKPSYYQIVFLVDVSNSMAIGGTQAAIASLQSNTLIDCAFACHDPNHYDNPAAPNNCYFPATTKTTTTGSGRNKKTTTTTTPAVNDCDKRALAAAAGIQLKIDFVNQAVQTFLTQLGPYASAYPNHFTVGIYTFGTGVNTLTAPTTNLANATTAAKAIDVEAADDSNYGYTTTTAALTSLQSLPNVGDGSSPTSMITYVIFLSDGVEDLPSNATQWGRNTDLNYTAACTKLNKTMKVFSIWAPYYAIPGDDQYNTLVAPLSNQLGPTMQGCAASPSYYFTANDGPAIQQAVTSTFNVIITNSGLRVSQ
ncbi:MAG: TadE/TadG family type IV pilus assembly protein [Caulobacteraceae bacterium]